MKSKKNPWLNKHLSWTWEKDVNADSIIKELSLTSKDKVLDIGCGPGAYLNDIQKKTKAKCYGIDIRTDIFKQNKNKNLKLKEGSMLNLPFKDNTFSKIFSLGTLEHDPDTAKIFSEISRVMKKNGKLMFTVPNLISLFHVTKKVKQMFGLWDLGYEASFTIKNLEKLLFQYGFIIEKAYIMPHYKVHNPFNKVDDILNNLNNKKFGFFIKIIASKNE